MARTALTPVRVTTTGLKPTPLAANVDGHSFPAGGRYLLVMINDSAGSVTATFPTPRSVDGNLAVADRTVTLLTTETWTWTDQNKPEYVQDDGSVWVNFSAVADVFVYLLRIG